jgi:hypothetical protein
VTLRPHLLAFAALGAALPIAAAVFLLGSVPARNALAGPPDHGLPYREASFTAADARRAFAAEGFRLTPRSRTTTSTTLGNHGDVLEVDAFAARAQVERAGFYDYIVEGGKYVHFPRDCTPGHIDAERWHGNIRVIVNCPKAGNEASAWLLRVDRALARL